VVPLSPVSFVELRGGYNYDSTSIRLQFDRDVTIADLTLCVGRCTEE